MPNATTLLQTASEQGFMGATYQLATYHQQDGNVLEARRWFLASAEQGNYQALKMIRKMVPEVEVGRTFFGTVRLAEELLPIAEKFHSEFSLSDRQRGSTSEHQVIVRKLGDSLHGLLSEALQPQVSVHEDRSEL